MKFFQGFRAKQGIAVAALLGLAVLALSCGDVFRPVANPIIAPTGDPQLTHFVYVLNQNAPANFGSVMHVDVSGDSVVSNVQVGMQPVHAAFLPPGASHVFTANKGNDSVTGYIPGFTSILPPI